MKTIRFSHKYSKMPKETDKTYLLEVFNSEWYDLHNAFVEYDTKYYDEYGNKLNYPLPNRKLIVLLLYSYGDVWTTVRRWTAEKEAYYRSLRGQQVNIEVQA